MQRRSQFQAPPDDFALFHLDDRGHDFDSRFRPRSGVNQLLKHAVIFRPAVRITGTIFRNRSDVDCARSNHFRPAYCHGKKVSIAKRNVGHWNRAALRPGRAQLIFRHGNLFVCQRRPANRAKMIELHHKALARAVEVRNLFEGPALASLRPLPVACVKQRDVSHRATSLGCS